jgi:hypothetical protein
MVAQDAVKHLLLLAFSHEQQLLAGHDLLLPQILLGAAGADVLSTDFSGRFYDRRSGQAGSCHDTQRSSRPLEKDPLADKRLILFFARVHTHHLLFSHNGLLVLCFKSCYALKKSFF